MCSKLLDSMKQDIMQCCDAVGCMTERLLVYKRSATTVSHKFNFRDQPNSRKLGGLNRNGV